VVAQPADPPPARAGQLDPGGGMMRLYLSATLSGYIGRLFFTRFLAVFFAFTAIVFLFDFIELLRRAATKADAPFAVIVRLSLLKLPHMAQELIPFVVLFATMLTFWRLTRSHELTVVRAAGVSVWQFLLPALALALLIGAVRVTLLNPMAAALYSRFEQVEAKTLRGRTSMLAVSPTGFWLREVDSHTNAIIHAQRMSSRDMELYEVIFFNLVGKDKFASRIDAATARLESGMWIMRDAWISSPEQPERFEAEYRLPTEMTLERIQESFASPETISFWDLPGFINTLEAADFSAVRHRLHYQRLLSGPLLLFAMVLVAASFSLRAPRRGGGQMLLAFGTLIGFVLFFISNLVAALGQSGSIPVQLAAWTPAGISTLLGVTLLLHLEDG
jgi:lipopolysaccharide export system permease protein